MAKKSRRRRKTSAHQTKRQQAPQAPQTQPQPWRRKMILGVVILALVIGIGVFVRYWQQSRIPPQLKGAIDNHYTRGVAGAPVVIKEFSDFT
jgi:uncharacterized protein HemX